ncbi:hypothetical protein PHMEG_00033659 [Phytophthora megakarya]|uniref:Eukaryotic/viral aspartic protease n=1 Tax=Phytophthora megakarya TaxID=4795 RepID=A0A225USU4_9STRA|nr:hypothetical protein PHMEG_00033659 [Phytophthora megakarya]
MDGGMIMIKKRIGKSHRYMERLKLKLKFGKQISGSGLGGVPTNITASAKVKITLGPRVMYVVDVWVANIGGGLDVLLGMNFMFSAGVRLCVKEGLVQLPDEGTFLFSGRGLSHVKRDMEFVQSILCIFDLESTGWSDCQRSES